MTTPYPSLTLQGNLMVAIDVETTGRLAGHHEIVQIAAQPLNTQLEPLEGVLPFYMNIQPEYINRIEPDSMRVHGLSLSNLKETGLEKWKVADLFDEWFQRLDLPHRKSLIPLAHNWAFEAGFLKHWLGLESFSQFFHPHPRDTMLLALSIQDRAVFRGENLPFKSFGLGALCKWFDIPLDDHHDALADALAVARLYKGLLLLELI
jgi:DNA polymerase III epsilon subunit-like protein